MPINPNVLGTPQPDDAPERFPENQTTAPIESSGDQPKQRKRRTKKELTADAVVPADDALIEIKDAGTGAKVERPWLEAVALVKAEKAEFVDKGLKYALLKMEQQEVAPAFSQQAMEEVSQPITREDLEERKVPKLPADWNLPEGADLGDEVVVGADVYRMGHGGVLTSSPVADAGGNIIKPKRRWQRELGAGPDGPWESTALTQTSDPRPIFDKPPQNGKGSGDVETERLPRQVEQIGQFEWKIGTGILEKIGLPDYSSLQVGPLTCSRMIVDDGRRTRVFLGDREAEVPTAAIEGFEIMDNTLEFIARRFRGQLQGFLEATGALKQPVA
jgi:hypothetical protein